MGLHTIHPRRALALLAFGASGCADLRGGWLGTLSCVAGDVTLDHDLTLDLDDKSGQTYGGSGVAIATGEWNDGADAWPVTVGYVVPMVEIEVEGKGPDRPLSVRMEVSDCAMEIEGVDVAEECGTAAGAPLGAWRWERKADRVVVEGDCQGELSRMEAP